MLEMTIEHNTDTQFQASVNNTQKWPSAVVLPHDKNRRQRD